MVSQWRDLEQHGTTRRSRGQWGTQEAIGDEESGGALAGNASDRIVSVPHFGDVVQGHFLIPLSRDDPDALPMRISLPVGSGS